ncbi:hypothetical protein NMY22_g19958 [Coprinellus aureogranulatus]|nr:hypothetical protein NMY22_g19958 [Coprinellus aureogranulatus]
MSSRSRSKTDAAPPAGTSSSSSSNSFGALTNDPLTSLADTSTRSKRRDSAMSVDPKQKVLANFTGFRPVPAHHPPKRNVEQVEEPSSNPTPSKRPSVGNTTLPPLPESVAGDVDMDDAADGEDELPPTTPNEQDSFEDVEGGNLGEEDEIEEAKVRRLTEP